MQGGTLSFPGLTLLSTAIPTCAIHSPALKMSAGLILRAALAYSTSEVDWPSRPLRGEPPPIEIVVVVAVVGVIVVLAVLVLDGGGDGGNCANIYHARRRTPTVT